ncbi:O-succinylbenzoic acid-CoA ligase MenE or related acyl-CoA synthetase (AMP-forming) [Cupriavidus necator]|uniref:Acyl-CoA synthetase (AMP-forming)/AMP-acid ligase II n=1 Tax=Cupriavidus necator (strain ATCC 17699 / DSM 428 / KCTC 22496 / NCIMB 10442 / H16 / Stanier 337) TaxID=381666 RepID=Q0K1G2_CUPNH|nr:class I adenylate-forming enzyme family protein [Cupriavidus necator]QCC04022.1 long-chain fatty acid--CoA ligase [Cupriavidus necator H16]QQB78709.1 acyl--CoA ligase [Cupriavidus necator]WKA42920.1 class I adenylate-forming enzyme family protein [Cupriavidus necator]CAJ96162.1 Acyl-CoA synthetase (AMP-forming)/AMP-acid ligase II [Cupriavidus necator H16]
MPPDRDTPPRISDIPRRWAAETPGHVAVFEEGRTTTYAQLWAGIEDAQRYLQAQGVGTGDRVLITAENCLAVITLVFALSELGAWPVVVNARLSEREIEVIRAHCQPRLMLFTHAVSPDALRHGVRYRAREIAPAGLGPLMAGAVDEAGEREPEALARDVAALIYTSGTTGQPKGVMVTHRGLLHFARVTVESRRMQADDCAYAVMPMSHVFGLGTLLVSTLQAGASLYLSARFNAADVTAAIRQGAITLLQGVPTMFNRIVAHVRATGTPLQASPRLRYLYTGGGPLDPTLKHDVEAMFGQPLHHGYGMTEYAGSLFVTRMDRPRTDCSAGEIVEGAELRVVGPEGKPVPQGQPGELWIRGPGVMRGYYRAPDLSAEALRPDGWLNTGDIGRLDPGGALFIVGRTKDLIIRSGFNVYPIEVESVINTHPSVRVSAVIGQPTADGNEEVIAFVEIRDGEKFDAQALHDYLVDRLSPYKRPERILRVASIPTTASGKLLKHQLRQMLADKA